MNINKAIICGRITKDIELRTTQSGTSVASFSVATNYSWKDKNTGQKQEEVTFHNITIWGKLAEIAHQYLIKGQEVYIEGRIKTTQYTDKQSVVRYKTEIVADEMQMGQKPKSAQQPATPPPAPVPAPISTQATLPNPGEVPTINVDDDEIKIEDIPF